MDNSDKQNAKFLGIIPEMLELREVEKRLLVKALRDIVFAARTTGGVAGRDGGLVEACEKAEAVLAQLGKSPVMPAYFIGTETGIEDIENPPSDN